MAPLLAGMAVAAITGTLLLRDGDDPEAATSSGTTVAGTATSAGTAATTTTTTRPGVVGVPEDRFGAQLVLHPPTGQVVMIGGGEPLNNGQIGEMAADTWTLDTSEWVWRAHGPEGLPPRIGHAAAADGNSDRIVVFGGTTDAPRTCGVTGPCTGSALDDTWLFDPATGAWQQADTGAAPSPRYGAGMAYDDESGLLILFGGGLRTAGFSNTTYDDTWIFETASATWTEIETDRAPSPRAWHQMVYDPGTDRIFLFGGGSRDELDAIAWTFDANSSTWEPLETEGPATRWGAAIAIDPASRRLTVIGGQGPVVRQIGSAGTATEVRFLSDVWSYDLESETWTEFDPLERPVIWTSGVYEPEGGRLVTSYLVVDVVTGDLIPHTQDPG